MKLFLHLQKFLETQPWLREKAYKQLYRSGFDIIDGVNPFRALLTRYGIDLVFDVGANTGQYCQRIRQLGYKGEVISFEPIEAIYKELAKQAVNDPLWKTVHTGCGDYNGEAVINVTVDSVFSSMLLQTSLYKAAKYANAAFVEQQTVSVCTLDTVFNQFYTPGKRVLLKIDAQGYDKKVLDGAHAVLKNILAVQLELSFIAHYEGEPLIKEMLDYMFAQGFTLVAQEPLQNNLKRKKLLKADGFFFRLDQL